MLEKLQKIQKLVEECMEELSKPGLKIKLKKQKVSTLTKTAPNFSLNERAFMKKYGKNLSGPKKFVILTAYIAKGNTKKIVKSEEITKKWNKLLSFMGGKSQKNYSTRAKENGWINSPEYGNYVLTEEWIEILK